MRLAVLAIAAAALSSCSSARPFLMLSHESDPTTSEYSETTMDFAGAGVELELADDRVAVDLALGVKAFNCEAFTSGRCPSTPGASAAVRWFPGGR